MKHLMFLLLLLSLNKATKAQDTITAAQVKGFIGKKVTLCDRVNYGKFVNISKTSPVELRVGPDYPNHYMSLVFPQHHLKRFSFDPEKKMLNKRFCVKGTVTRYKGKPAIYITKEAQVNAEE